MSHHALIIGGGIAGASMALFLKRIGWEATIFEAYPQRSDIGGGLQIAPNGMRVLKALGIANQIIKKGTIPTETRFQNQQGRVLARINKEMKEKYGQPSINILRSALHISLVEEVQKQGIEIQYKKRLVDLANRENEQVVAYFEDGSEARGDILIGADGLHSRTRAVILPDGPKPEYTGLQWVAGFLSLAEVSKIEPSDKVLHMIFGQKGFFGYGNFCEQDGTIGWWFNVSREQERSREEMAAIPTEQLRKDLLELCKDWHGPVEELIAKTPKFMMGNVHDIQSLPKWHRNRVVLIGDAAHAVSPNSGQGASLALEDSMYLAKLLAQSPEDWQSVFDQFEQHRRPRVEKIIAQGRRNGNDKKELTPFSAWIRDQILSIVLPLFGEKGNRWIYQYKINWEK
jgi:2-polyprenyl-6-methoxyphenol hydroxylase-like FAD-dependent oxidoreductase